MVCLLHCIVLKSVCAYSQAYDTLHMAYVVQKTIRALLQTRPSIWSSLLKRRCIRQLGQDYRSRFESYVTF
ncbi:hypothetical protein F4818DRAFT_420594 [Hypoxylon cercidicola]|nr:hypothetical protein F4818DRAFT_420594 [Hypoxylon cercidicola]